MDVLCSDVEGEEEVRERWMERCGCVREEVKGGE